MTKIQKTKEWIKEHQEQIGTAVVVTGIAAFYTAVVVFSFKAYKDQAKQDELTARRNHENRQLMAQAIGRGAQIIPGPDNGFWILEPKAS